MGRITWISVYAAIIAYIGYELLQWADNAIAAVRYYP